MNAPNLTKKYQVIGGQYNFVFYYETNSLKGAKQVAQKNKEYWDNHQGWRTPKIYLTEDIQSDEYEFLYDVPPYMIYNENLGKWEIYPYRYRKE